MDSTQHMQYIRASNIQKCNTNNIKISGLTDKVTVLLKLLKGYSKSPGETAVDIWLRVNCSTKVDKSKTSQLSVRWISH